MTSQVPKHAGLWAAGVAGLVLVVGAIAAAPAPPPWAPRESAGALAALDAGVSALAAGDDD
jgi:hypothetical protein